MIRTASSPALLRSTPAARQRPIAFPGAVACAVLAAAAAAVPAAAQVTAQPGARPAAQATARLHGRILAEGDSTPIVGALVELLDEADAAAIRGLTGTGGGFVLRARPGTYRVSVGMLGYATTTTGWVELPAGESVTLDVVVALEPVRLEGIRASTDRRCGRPRGPDLVRVWGEARKVLASVDVAGEARAVRFQLAIRDRDLDPEYGRVLQERTQVRRAWNTQSFRSASVDELLDGGFIHSAADTATYYAPDAEVLLSDAFLGRYCFSVVDGEAAEIGLAFEPQARDRDRSQIEGVLWLDRGGRGLRRLEFDYLDAPVIGGDPGGEVHYLRLPNGTWIVSEWVIRMPRPTLVDGLLTRRLGGIHETRGSVVSVRGPDFTLRPGEDPGPVVGRVIGERGEPLGNVLVYLEGTPHADTTAADGSFRLDRVPAGRYRLRWLHPSLRPDESGAASVDLPTDTALVVRAALRPAAAVGCLEAGGSAILGTITDDDAGLPIPGVEVRLRAADGAARRDPAADAVDDPAAGSAAAPSAGAATRTGPDGGFRFCDLAPGRWRVDAGLTRADRASATIALAADTARRVDLAIPLPRSPAAADGAEAVGPDGTVVGRVPGGGGGRLIGTVLDGADGRPVVGATVTIGAGTADSVQVLTDHRGRFLARGLSGRLVPLRITHVGIDPVEDTVFVRAGELVHLEVRVDPITLDPITVTARRRGILTDVYWRADQGLGGLFLTEAEIRARTPSRVTDALRARPGVHLTTAGSGRTGRLEFRGGCAPEVYIDGIRVTKIPARRSAAALGEAYGAVNMVHPWSIEIMEIYRGASEVPAEFGGSTGGCGAVAIWTHRGGAARPPPRRLLPPGSAAPGSPGAPAGAAACADRSTAESSAGGVTTWIADADRPVRQLLCLRNDSDAPLHVDAITLDGCTNVREPCGRHDVDVLVPPGQTRPVFDVHRLRPRDAVWFAWTYDARSG